MLVRSNDCLLSETAKGQSQLLEIRLENGVLECPFSYVPSFLIHNP